MIAAKWLGLFLWSLSLATPARANCLLAFAAAGPSERPLIVLTYTQLLEELGGRLTPERLKEMADGGDPFRLPEASQRDLDSLQARLREFREMLQKKEWLDEATMSDLRETLRARSTGGSQAEDRVKQQTKVSQPDVPMEFPNVNWHSVQYSPDSRYLVYRVDGSSFTNWSLSIYDRQTKTRTLVPGNGLNSESPFFARDGRLVVPAMNEQKINVVPFRDGVPQWSEAKSFGEGSQGSTWLHGQGISPGWLLAGDALIVYRYDLQSGARAQVDFQRFMRTVVPTGPNPSVRTWGFVPGTDRLFLYYESGEKKGYVTADVSSDGKLTLVEKFGPWNDPQHRWGEVEVGKDGKEVYLWTNDPLSPLFVADARTAPQPFFGGEAPVQSIRHVFPLPDGQAAVLMRDGTTLQFHDAQRKLLSTTKLPGKFQWGSVVDGGDRLILYGDEVSNGEQALDFNLQQRMP